MKIVLAMWIAMIALPVAVTVIIIFINMVVQKKKKPKREKQITNLSFSKMSSWLKRLNFFEQ